MLEEVEGVVLNRFQVDMLDLSTNLPDKDRSLNFEQAVQMVFQCNSNRVDVAL
jgi:hypothetical protein